MSGDYTHAKRPVDASPVEEPEVPVGEFAVPMPHAVPVAGIAPHASPLIARKVGSASDPLGGTPAGTDVVEALRRRRGKGTPLPEDIAQRFGTELDTDLSPVRVHTDPEADKISRSVGAQAFTHGSDIYFSSGSYGTGAAGQRLLAHELAHVAQNAAGRFRGGGGGTEIGRADDPAERDADRTADQVMSALRRAPALAGVARSGGPAAMTSEVVRRAQDPDDPVAAAEAHTQADAAHDAARNQLKAWVEEGAKSLEPRLRNSCEAVLKGNIKLYAVTLTGDSWDRTIENYMDPDTMGAWYPQVGSGNGDVLSGAVTYNYLDLWDNTNIWFEDFNTPGGALGNEIAVFDPLSRTKDYLFETLRHEAQHALDKHAEKGAAAVTGDPTAQIEAYKTEYRAYNYEKNPETDQKSPIKKVKAAGAPNAAREYEWTERQLHVFQQIYKSYEHTGDGWDQNYPIGGKTFQELVVEYVNPDTEGFNKNNSLAVDDLYSAVGAFADNSNNTNTPEAKSLLTEIGKLDKDDAIFMAKENADWKKLIEKKFGPDLRRRVLDALEQKAA